jgi:hypothetical protein
MEEKKIVNPNTNSIQGENPHTQIPTIRDAVTYIIDEQGNEVKESQSAERKAQSEKTEENNF